MIKTVSLYLLFSFLFLGSVLGFEPVKSDTLVYKIDVAKSKLFWSCNIHRGYVLLKEGTLKILDNKVAGANVVFQMDSIVDQDITYDLMRGTLQNILKSDVFFNTKKYPVSRFLLDKATSLTGNTYHIEGDLELMGVAACITFNAQVSRKGKMLEIRSEKFYIDRLRWGITSYSSLAATSEENFIVSDSIGISFELKASRR